MQSFSEPSLLRVVGALRRIAQAMDSHSRWLDSHARLTVPQLLVLEALRASGTPLAAGAVARQVSLTQGTVTSILDRLQAKDLVSRVRADDDRRRVMVALTRRGRQALQQAPDLMHAQFVQRFSALPDAEREALTATLERVADLVRTEEPPHAPPPATRTREMH